MDGKRYSIQKGDIFIFNNTEPHFICDLDPAEKFINLVIIFDPRFIWSFEGDLFDKRYLDIFFSRNERFENRISRDNEVIITLQKLFEEIEQEFTNQFPEYPLMIKVKLLNILVVLTRYFCNPQQEKTSDFRKRKCDLEIITRVTNFINDNYSTDITLNQLADIAHMNASYFSTFYKKYMGLSPLDFLIRKRINIAAHQIRNSDKPILEIANHCGFNNTANFNRAFKKIIGRTPSQLRQN